MTKDITNRGEWKPGTSGNPKGRPSKGKALTEMLRLKGEQVVMIGGEPITAQEALAKAVWQFVTTGEVWLSGKRQEAENVSEWANVVKWLYSHSEPISQREDEEEPELIVRVVREERRPHPLASSAFDGEGDAAEENPLPLALSSGRRDDEEYPLPLAPSPLHREGEPELIVQERQPHPLTPY